MSITLTKIKGSLERVLDKNLQDLVRGIRNHKDSEVSLWEWPSSPVTLMTKSEIPIIKSGHFARSYMGKVDV